MLFTGRYHTDIEFFSTKNRRFLNRQTWIRSVVVTPVMAGVETASTATHEALSHNRGLSAPLTM